jgi:hypothetical protein
VTITTLSQPIPKLLHFHEAPKEPIFPSPSFGNVNTSRKLTPGEYHHVKEVRIAEWPVEFLRRPRRTPNTIPDFLSPNAPANRLDILRGLANPK